MSNFLIHVLDSNVITSYGMPCCIGEIQIGKFKEAFEMPLEYWTIADYQKQWKAGIERIKTYNQSYLVAELQDPNQAPRAVLWVFYKEGDKIYIQNHMLFRKRFINLLKKRPFTAETCYEFISPRETMSGEDPISEWVIDLINLTFLDTKYHGQPKRKEIGRVKEALVDYFVYDNEYGSSDELWQNYSTMI